MEIFCVKCNKKVEPRLTNGEEIYPHRKDLYNLPFWKCDECKNYVGCHHKTNNPTRPLGCIPTKEIIAKRQEIHRLLDPLWENGNYDRKQIYKLIGDKLGYKYHTANIRSVEEADKIITIIKQL